MTILHNTKLIVSMVIAMFTIAISTSQTAPLYNKTDETVADCLENHIITGQYFLINISDRQLNLLQSSLKTTVACQREVSSWINECNTLNHSMNKCIQTSLTITQALIQDAWAHRNNLIAWRNR